MLKPVNRSRSWSSYCRERVASYVRQINRGKNGACIAWAFDNLANSYRPPIFRYRSAKLLRRAIKAGKVKETLSAVREYQLYRNERAE